MDVYPYTASATNIASALLPAWALEGGHDATLARLKDPAQRTKIRAETVRILRDERGGGDPQNVQLSRCEWDDSLSGKRLGDVTRQRGQAVTFETAADTVFWIVEQGNCCGIFHAISEDDLQRVLRHSASMVGSDGDVQVFGRANPHPRSYGTFVRVLGRYVRELKILSLEEAVRKMSAFPAQRLGLADRGVIREGLKADVVIFDPEAVRDRATFEQPHQYGEGVTHVLVNGEIVFADWKMTPARPGRILRH
jgi:dihydroorotase/N-acyl-D-amino-acid deacylase